MASVRNYAKALILSAAAFAFSGCEITRDLDNTPDSILAKHPSEPGVGGTSYGRNIPPGPEYRPASTPSPEVYADVIDLDEIMAEMLAQRQAEAQRRLNEIIIDPQKEYVPSNWRRSMTPKAPPAYLNEDEAFPGQQKNPVVRF